MLNQLKYVRIIYIYINIYINSQQLKCSFTDHYASFTFFAIYFNVKHTAWEMWLGTACKIYCAA